MSDEKTGMRTIAFYSYKGGVGRSLTVANVAMYLARLGKRVFVIDMDLEAPGLHYKFKRRDIAMRPGMVDILRDFDTSGQPPESLEPFVIDVGPEGESAGKVYLLPAGASPSPAYWKNLAKLNWFQMFYSDEPQGVLMFAELRAFIEEDYKPDFLLLDARTGITEMGGVAITVLADQVVFLTLGTHEHLEGTRAVMRSVHKQSVVRPESPKVDIVAVLSRLPSRKDDDDVKELERVRAYLNEPADELAATLAIDEVFPLHREPALEEQEFVLVGAKHDLDDSPLLADYIRLFTNFISPKEFANSARVIADLFEKAAEDPDDAEKAMEELSLRFAHPDASRALLRMYRLRRSPAAKLLVEARKLYRMTRDGRDPLLWEIVRKYDHREVFASLSEEPLRPSLYVDFVYEVWLANGSNNSLVAEKIAALCRQIDDFGRARRTFEKLLASTDSPSPSAVVKFLDLLREHREFARALEIVDRFKSTMRTVESFVEAWANVVLTEANYTHLSHVTKDAQFPWAILQKKNAPMTARLRLFANDRPAAELHWAHFMTEMNIRHVVQSMLISWGALARDLGKKNEFEMRIRKVFDQASCNSIIDAIVKIPELPPDDFGYDGGDDIPF